MNALGSRRKILIIDEGSFSKICSAILLTTGYETETAHAHDDSFSNSVNTADHGLIITSYPYCSLFMGELCDVNVPLLILSDQLSMDLVKALNDTDNTYCMLKPIDYEKFRSLVKDVMSGDLMTKGGYKIV